jgi:hypothetical protein
VLGEGSMNLIAWLFSNEVGSDIIKFDLVIDRASVLSEERCRAAFSLGYDFSAFSCRIYLEHFPFYTSADVALTF